MLAKVVVSKSKNTIQEASRMALKMGLYQSPSWTFYELLTVPKATIRMATAFVNRKRVGISIYWDYELMDDYAGCGYYKQVGCYVKDEYRRQGIGTQLIERMNVSESVAVGTGIFESQEFWAKVKPQALSKRGDPYRYIRNWYIRN
jgi:GNAT superfamily N-acetyltransferase